MGTARTRGLGRAHGVGAGDERDRPRAFGIDARRTRKRRHPARRGRGLGPRRVHDAGFGCSRPRADAGCGSSTRSRTGGAPRARRAARRSGSSSHARDLTRGSTSSSSRESQRAHARENRGPKSATRRYAHLMDPRVESMRAVLHEAFRDRRVVLAGGPVAGSTGRVAALRALGAERCLVLGVGRGTGPLPSERDADVVEWDLPAVADVAAAIRAEEVLFRDPPPPFVDALARFDPRGRRARARHRRSRRCTSSRGGPRTAGAGRSGSRSKTRPLPMPCSRRRRWPTPPFEIVPAERRALVAAAAAARLRRGHGLGRRRGSRDSTARRPMCTGSSTPTTPRSRSRSSRSRCARVRVAAFVEGIPCSVHGFVTDDGIAVFRPVELMVLRGAHAPRFRFAGAGTIWDPPATDRAEIRDAAGRVGARLREQVGFRGRLHRRRHPLRATAGSPTSAIPRFGAGLQYTRAALPELGLDLLHHAVIAGDGPDVTAAAARGSRPLGRRRDALGCGVDGDDERRPGPTARRCPWSVTPRATALPRPKKLRMRRSRTARARWVASCAASSSPSAFPTGASTAPRAVAALAFADAHCRRRHRPACARPSRGALIGADYGAPHGRGAAVRHPGRAVSRRSGGRARRARPGRGRRRAGRASCTVCTRGGSTTCATLEPEALASARALALFTIGETPWSDEQRGAILDGVRAGRPRGRVDPLGDRLVLRLGRVRRARRRALRRPSVDADVHGRRAAIATHPACAHLGARVELARRGVPVPRSAARRAGAPARARRRARPRRRRRAAAGVRLPARVVLRAKARAACSRRASGTSRRRGRRPRTCSHLAGGLGWALDAT